MQLVLIFVHFAIFITRWLPGFARVPYYAPSPCHMHPFHNCHHIKSCHPPEKQYTVIPVHYFSFVITKYKWQGPRCGMVCEYILASALLRIPPLKFPTLLPCSLPSSLNPPSARFLPPAVHASSCPFLAHSLHQPSLPPLTLSACLASSLPPSLPLLSPFHLSPSIPPLVPSPAISLLPPSLHPSSCSLHPLLPPTLLPFSFLACSPPVVRCTVGPYCAARSHA